MSHLQVLLILIYWMATFLCIKSFSFGWELRFNGGESSDLEGRLEIRYGDQWGYVCADGFGQVEGDVICKIIENSETSPNKLQAVEVYPVPNSRLDIKPIILEGVKCNGSEDRLFECQHNGLFNARCPSSAVVGVKCGQSQRDHINRGVVPRTHIGVYFCDMFARNKVKVHCDAGTRTEATHRLLLDNNVRKSTSSLRERRCTWEDASVIQLCITNQECSENNTDSVICIHEDMHQRHALLREGADLRYMRLVGGNSSREGRIEVSLGFDTWGSVCSRFWGYGSARFACHHLGFTGVEEYGTVEENGSYAMLQYLSCNDEQETYWYDCLHRYTWPEKNVCSSYVSVICSDFANEGTLRLTGTTVAVEGRVEIFHDGVWGSVRHRFFSTIVCKQLGYPGSNFSSEYIKFKQSAFAIPVTLDVIACEGTEVSLLECDHRWYNDSHVDTYRGGFDVRCNRPGNFTPRLYNGTSVHEGRLELWEGNQWRRVCSSTIGRHEAEVICKQLGDKTLETFYNWPKFGNGINPVLSWSFRCDHLVTSLRHCKLSYLTTRNMDCDSVAVKCTKRENNWDDLEQTGTIIKVLLGVAFSLLGFGIVSGLVLFRLKRKRIRRNGPTEEDHGQQIPLEYSSVPTTSPEVNISEQDLDPPDEPPPPSYETLLNGHSEVTVEPESCDQVDNSST